MRFLFLSPLFSSYKFGTVRTLFRKVLKIIPLIISKIISGNRISCYINIQARKIKISDTNYVGLIVAPSNYGEIFPVEGYLEPTKIEFENNFYSVPKNYKTYIKNRYGEIKFDILDKYKINYNYVKKRTYSRKKIE